MRLLLIAACFAGLVHGQEPSIRVDGRVTTLSGEAVSGALVRLQGTSTYSHTTDGDGRFAFLDVAPGRYTLTSEKLGFVTHPYGARSDEGPGAQLVLDTGIELRDLSLPMTPLAVLYGRVTDPDGKPVAKAALGVYRDELVDGKRQLVAVGMYDGRGVTDDQGNYRVSLLPSGRYYVKATPARDIRGQDGGAAPRTMTVATFYPNAPDTEGATQVNVEAGGEVRGIDIRLHQVRVYSIRGKAIDAATGTPAGGVNVVDATRAPGPTDYTVPIRLQGLAKAGPDGSFEVRNLMPGRHILQVLAAPVSCCLATDEMFFFFATAPGSRITGRVEVTITDSDLNGVVMPLISVSVLTGMVKLEDGDLRNWRSQEWRVQLVPIDGVTLNIPSGTIEADGKFEIQGVAPMKYSVSIGGLPAGVSVKSIRLGGEDVTRGTLDLTSGAAGLLEIVLWSKGSR
jgi:hypothetical protein